MKANPPIAMLAELTHRCPLRCVYCSNPVEMDRREDELSAEEWAKVFADAASLGVLQLHLSGGEPASRRDIVKIIEAAREAGLYINLITSGIGVNAKRLDAVVEAGLDHIQLSLQGVRASSADHISGYKGGFDRKITIANEIKSRGIPLTLNAVMHRQNLDDIDTMIEMAIKMQARRIEIACVQFHGWALLNRAYLLPTREQTETIKAKVLEYRAKLEGVLAIDFVPPDYYATHPKACMGGWGSTGIVVTPNGDVLPCHAAKTIPHLEFDNVKSRPLAEIWQSNMAFEAYRGTQWMSEPCASCDRKLIDYGGCRCQAMRITGDAAKTDPICNRSPDRHLIDELLDEKNLPKIKNITYRRFR